MPFPFKKGGNPERDFDLPPTTLSFPEHTFNEVYCLDNFVDEGISIPIIRCLVSTPRIFEVFLSLLDTLFSTHSICVVILETSHYRRDNKHDNIPIELLFPEALPERLLEFSDVISHDRNAGIAIYGESISIPNKCSEIQVDGKKEIVIYSQIPNELERFADVLNSFNIPQVSEMHFPCTAKVKSQPGDIKRFYQLVSSIQADDGDDYWCMVHDDDHNAPKEPS